MRWLCLGFEIYRSDYLETIAEREQMIKLVHYLEKEFSNRKENCVLIIEPYLPVQYRGGNVSYRPDAIIIKDNVFCIIEMK